MAAKRRIWTAAIVPVAAITEGQPVRVDALD
jgi:hypothetical protein